MEGYIIITSERVVLENGVRVGYNTVPAGNNYDPFVVKIAEEHAKKMKKHPEIKRLEERVVLQEGQKLVAYALSNDSK